MNPNIRLGLYETKPGGNSEGNTKNRTKTVRGLQRLMLATASWRRRNRRSEDFSVTTCGDCADFS